MVQFKIKLLQAQIVAVLVLKTLCINATANNGTQQITYSVGATTPVCVLPIDYTNCSDPGIKLNYHSSTSTSSVGILLYNKLYRPDRLAAKTNTTEYGFLNVTSERNSSLCLHFMGMSVLANGLTFSLEQFCGVTKLDREKTDYFKFILVNVSTCTYPPTTRVRNITSSSSENQRNNKKFSSGEIWGIVIGVIAAICNILSYINSSIVL